MELGQLLWVILLLIVSLPFIISLLQQKHNPKKLPPTPWRLPLLGNLHQLLGPSLPHVCLQKLAHKHGPLMFLQLGSIPTIVISSFDVAKDVFKSHDITFSGRPPLYAASRLSYGCIGMSFSPYGHYWRQVRKITILELLSLKRVHSFGRVREEEVGAMVDVIHRSQTKPVDLSRLTLLLANNVVCRLAFGRKCDGKGKFSEILRDTQRLLGELNVADFYPWLGRVVNKVNGLDARLEKCFKELDMFYDEVIDEHHLDESRARSDDHDHEDLVDVLLRLQRDPTQTITLNNNQVKAILTDVFIAGSDTSSATLVWAISELIMNPTTLKKAQDEVRQVAKGKQRVEEIDLQNLSYLKLVLKETLRLHPPVPLLVPRETMEPCTIRGYEIPSKTRVFINAKAISTDPNVWHIDPNAFKPDRFLDCALDYKGQDFEFIPFGVGRRGCPALNFAIILIEFALANLLFCFDWNLPHGVTRDDINMDEAIGLTTHKKDPLVLFATSDFLSTPRLLASSSASTSSVASHSFVSSRTTTTSAASTSSPRRLVGPHSLTSSSFSITLKVVVGQQGNHTPPATASLPLQAIQDGEWLEDDQVNDGWDQDNVVQAPSYLML